MWIRWRCQCLTCIYSGYISQSTKSKAFDHSVYGGAPLTDRVHFRISDVYHFSSFKKMIQKWKKSYRHKEWVLLSISSINFWEITIAKTSETKIKSSIFKIKTFPPIWTSYFCFCNKLHVQLERHIKTIIVIIWCTYIQSQTRKKIIITPAQINLQE